MARKSNFPRASPIFTRAAMRKSSRAAAFGIDEVRPSIDIVSTFRTAPIVRSDGVHAFAQRVDATMSEMREDPRFPGVLIHVSSYVDEGATSAGAPRSGIFAIFFRAPASARTARSGRTS